MVLTKFQYVMSWEWERVDTACTGAPQTPAMALGAVTDQSTVPSVFHALIIWSGHNQIC